VRRNVIGVGRDEVCNMDKRVLIGVVGIFAVVIVVGLVFALSSGNGDDENDNGDVAEDANPTEETADVSGENGDASTDEDEEASTDEADAEADTEEETDEPEAPAEDVPEDEVQLPSGEPERPQSDTLAYGFNIAWRADEEGQQFNEYTRQAVDTAGFNWVKFQVHWSEIQREPDWYDPLPVDRMVELYEGTETRILISVVGAPEWARDPNGEQLLADYEPFVGFMAFMANRYQGRVHAWEIWNEQNMAHEMHGTVRVSDYASLLEAGYRGVKDADPDALVVFGGLSPTGINDPEVAVNDVEYLEAFYLHGNGHYAQFFDVMGMHLNATNNPPDTTYPDNPGPGEWSDHNSFYFLRGQDLRTIMTDFGDERPVWVTEFGWTTENMAEGYEYGADVSEEDQANFLTGAFDVAREQMPWVSGMFVWNLNYTTLVSPEDEKYAWSVLYDNWSPRPAYTALQEMPKP
jgi:polysaccharide biosynthesis protein PslG